MQQSFVALFLFFQLPNYGHYTGSLFTSLLKEKTRSTIISQ